MPNTAISDKIHSVYLKKWMGTALAKFNDVWIGYECVTLPGVTIGDAAIIAARFGGDGDVAPYSGDVAPYSIVGGVASNPQVFWGGYHPKTSRDKMVELALSPPAKSPSSDPKGGH